MWLGIGAFNPYRLLSQVGFYLVYMRVYCMVKKNIYFREKHVNKYDKKLLFEHVESGFKITL